MLLHVVRFNISFVTKVEILKKPHFIGLENFQKQIFSSSQFFLLIVNHLNGFKL